MFPVLADWSGSLASGLLDVVWPPRCDACDTAATMSGRCSVCENCERILAADHEEACPRCTTSVGPYSDLSEGCSRCRHVRYRFTAAVRLGRYDGLLRECVLKSKHESGESLAESLGRILAATRTAILNEWKPDAIVPVPLHWWRRWTRGYNQSEAIARGMAGEWNIPLRCDLLTRTRATASQTTMSPTMRWENLRGAFRVRRPSAARGLRIVLVDDVLTTGATCDAVAAALIEAGAAQVTVAVLAHR